MRHFITETAQKLRILIFLDLPIFSV